MNTKIIVFSNKKKLAGILCNIFTGGPEHHIGFMINDNIYDMFLMRRKTKLDHWKRRGQFIYIFDSPVEISEEYFVNKILNDNVEYGFLDYIAFTYRWFFKILLKKKLKDKSGLICSEMVNEDLIDNGFVTKFKKNDFPPSPHDMLKYLIKISPNYKLIKLSK